MTDYSELRHQLHEHPQTAGNEQFAHDMIVRHLQGLHPDKVYTHVGGWGVIAVWEARNVDKINDDKLIGSADNVSTYQHPTIAFRADTDALPVGHRCGHDGHTTILLRLAELVDGNVSTYQHINILLLWQPAEETGEGARAVLESGILQQYNIQAFYALHNLPGYPLGTVVLCPRTFAAASTGVVYRLDGRETHASTPEMGINPGMAIAEIIQRFNGGEAGFRQCTLICIRVGQPAFGTSAGHGEVMFTLRAFTNSEMEKLLSEANQVVDEVSARYGLKVSRSLVEPFRATENHEECVNALMRQCVSVGATNTNAITQSHTNAIIIKEPFRWSEDFAEYLQHFPGAMFGIGAGEEHPELHHPDYDFPDDIIEPAARLFLRLAQDFNA